MRLLVVIDLLRFVLVHLILAIFFLVLFVLGYTAESHNIDHVPLVLQSNVSIYYIHSGLFDDIGSITLSGLKPEIVVHHISW
jgi:hypothetical protein